MAFPLFELRDLHVSTDDDKEILKGVNLTIPIGEVHALMGPNGSGKTTLASALLGHRGYRITSGSILFNGEDITEWSTDARGKAGIFLAFQYPEAISGVSVVQFLRQAMSARRGVDVSALEVRFEMLDWMDRLGMDPSFAERYLNEGFSGGEKKRNEVLQLALLNPDFAILDETDSGLDIDALRVVSRGINEVRSINPNLGALLVTHYQRFLDEVHPDKIHILIDGKIIASGGMEIVETLEISGYEGWR
jgi:Fe-S cluster assembly ATP-binding protein